MLKMRFVLTLVLALLGGGVGAQIIQFSGQPPAASGEPDFTRVLKIGAGGWVTGIDIAPDGQRLIRTDTGGGYIYNTTTGQWDQLITQARMPADVLGYHPTTGTAQIRGSYDGVHEIQAAHSDTSVIWLSFSDRMFKSTDRGQTFVQSTAFGTHKKFTNGDYRFNGRKMAVDPQNPDHVIVGTDVDGAFRTTNGGTSWSAPSGVPVAVLVNNTTDERHNPGYNIAFDPSSGLCSGRTCVIYIFAYEVGGSSVYRSADGGATWTATTGGPTWVQRMVVAPTGGALWASDTTGSGFEGKLWKYVHGSGWTTPINSNVTHAIAINPLNANHVVATDFGGGAYTSTDGATFGTTQGFTNAAGDVPWLGTTNSYYQSVGDIHFDPLACTSTPGDCRLFMTGGIGVWKQDDMPTSGNFVWTSVSAGIEQLVVRHVIAPNGVAIVGNSDRASFVLYTPDEYPTLSDQSTYRDAFPLAVTWQHDWASSDTNFIAARTASIDGLTENSGYTTDGGASKFKPFSGWYREGIPATAISNNGSGLIRVTVDDTSGLTTWSNGSGSIMRMLCSRVPPVAAFSVGNLINRMSFPVTVVNSTTVDLQSSTFDEILNDGGTCQLYEDWTPLDTNNELYTIAGVVNDGGLIRINVMDTKYGLGGYQRKVCVEGVVGTTEANGCWVTSGWTNATNSSGGFGSFTLVGSTYSNAYVSGGRARVAISPGGAIAASTPQNIAIAGSNQSRFLCTTNGGQTWKEMMVPPLPTTSISSASWSSNTLTVNVPIKISGGTYFKITGATPSAYNGVYALTGDSYSMGIGSGSITNGGSGYTNGSYSSVQIYADGIWPPALANVTVSGGAVTSVTITYGGSGFADGMLAGFLNLSQVGGTGSGFVYTVTQAMSRMVAVDNTDPGTYVSGGTAAVTAVETGWSNASYLNRMHLAADRVTPNKFYAYNSLYGFYSWENCDDPTVVSSQVLPFSGFNARIVTVPGYAGHVFATAGPQGNAGDANPGGTTIWRSTNGAVSWQQRAATTVLQPMNIAVGAVAPGSDYPTIYIVGWVDLDYGIWRTTATAAQWAADTMVWEKIETFPDGWTADPIALSGDLTDWRKWYMGAGSIGYWYGRKSYLLDPANDNNPMFLSATG
jgi:hypothetical protein